MPRLNLNAIDPNQPFINQLVQFGEKVREHFEDRGVTVSPPMFQKEQGSQFDKRLTYQATLKINGPWPSGHSEFGIQNQDPQAAVDIVIAWWAKFLNEVDPTFTPEMD